MAERFADYVDVATRIQRLYERYPEASLQTEVIELTDSRVVIKAYAYRTPDDPRPGIGHAWEAVPGKTQFQRGSELMVAETSAWGRAIAALGFEVRAGVSSREEVAAAKGRNLPSPKVAELGDEGELMSETWYQIEDQLRSANLGDAIESAYTKAGVHRFEDLPVNTAKTWINRAQQRLAAAVQQEESV